MDWREWKAVAEAYGAGWCAVSRSRWFGTTVTCRESYQRAVDTQRQGEELAVLIPVSTWQRLCRYVAEELERGEREIEQLRQRARELLRAKEQEKAELACKVEKLERTADGLREAVARWKLKVNKPVQEELAVPNDVAVEERYDGRKLTRVVRTLFSWDMPAEKVWELTPDEDSEGRRLREVKRRGKSVWLAVYR